MRKGGLRTRHEQRFEFRIERPGQHAYSFAHHALLFFNVIGGIPARRQHHVGVKERSPAPAPQRLPHVAPMRADNALHLWRCKLHCLHHASEIGVRGQHQFRFAPRCFDCCYRESSLGALASRENKFAPSHRHPVQLRRIIQAEQAAIHVAARGKLRQHRCQVAARSLHPAGCLQFGEEADNHGQSLPSAALNGKLRSITMFETRDSNACLRRGGIVLAFC